MTYKQKASLHISFFCIQNDVKTFYNKFKFLQIKLKKFTYLKKMFTLLGRYLMDYFLKYQNDVK